MLYNVTHRVVYPVFTLQSICQTRKHTDSHSVWSKQRTGVSTRLQINPSRPVFVYSKPPKQSASTFRQLKQTNRVKNTVTLQKKRKCRLPDCTRVCFMGGLCFKDLLRGFVSKFPRGHGYYRMPSVHSVLTGQ